MRRHTHAAFFIPSGPFPGDAPVLRSGARAFIPVRPARTRISGVSRTCFRRGSRRKDRLPPRTARPVAPRRRPAVRRLGLPDRDLPALVRPQEPEPRHARTRPADDGNVLGPRPARLDRVEHPHAGRRRGKPVAEAPRVVRLQGPGPLHGIAAILRRRRVATVPAEQKRLRAGRQQLARRRGARPPDRPRRRGGLPVRIVPLQPDRTHRRRTSDRERTRPALFAARALPGRFGRGGGTGVRPARARRVRRQRQDRASDLRRARAFLRLPVAIHEQGAQRLLPACRTGKRVQQPRGHARRVGRFLSEGEHGRQRRRRRGVHAPRGRRVDLQEQLGNGRRRVRLLPDLLLQPRAQARHRLRHGRGGGGRIGL